MSTKEQSAVVRVLPVGSWEYHGPHLPMDTDTLIAGELSQRFVSALNTSILGQQGILGELLPAIHPSCSHEHESSISTAPSTFLSVLDDVAAQCRGPLVIINAHGGNHLLENWVLAKNKERKQVLWFPRDWNWKLACEEAGIETSWGEDVHAGEIECSLMLALYPEKIDLKIAPEDHFCSNRRMWPVFGLSSSTKNGVIGAPSKASAEKGHKLLDALVRLALEELKILICEMMSAHLKEILEHTKPEKSFSKKLIIFTDEF